MKGVQKMLWKKLENFLDTSFFLPNYIAIDLTYRCPLNCKFCFIKRNNKIKKSKRSIIDASFVESVLRSLTNKKLTFYLTGGEPLLHPEFLNILKVIRNSNIQHRIMITTSLFVKDRNYLNKILKFKPDEIVVSLHGKETIHNSVTGSNKVYSIVLENLSFLKRNKDLLTKITIWCTVNSLNYRSLYEIAKFFISLKVDNIAFNHLEFITKKDLFLTKKKLSRYKFEIPVIDSEYLAVDIDTEVLYKEIRKIIYNFPKIKFFPALIDKNKLFKWYNYKKSYKRNGFCRGQFKALWLSPNKEILTCQPLAVKIAKCDKGFDIKDLYNSYEYKLFRRVLIESSGFFPVCSRCGREPYTSCG